jgi:hypothetical protein
MILASAGTATTRAATDVAGVGTAARYNHVSSRSSSSSMGAPAPKAAAARLAATGAATEEVAGTEVAG